MTAFLDVYFSIELLSLPLLITHHLDKKILRWFIWSGCTTPHTILPINELNELNE